MPRINERKHSQGICQATVQFQKILAVFLYYINNQKIPQDFFYILFIFFMPIINQYSQLESKSIRNLKLEKIFL